MNGGMNAAMQAEFQKEMMEHHQEMSENHMENHMDMWGEGMEHGDNEMEMNEFEGGDFGDMEDGMMMGYGNMMGAGMGMGAMGMNGMGMGAMGMNGMSMNGGMGMSAGMASGMSVIPVTGVRYKLKPYTYKYEYPVWKPDSKMGFVATTYNNPCAAGCSSKNPHCCHKEVTYVPKTVPKVVEETVSVPVEVDVPNTSCGCHASPPHCCRLSSPKWAYERGASRNQHYGAV